MLVWLSSSNSSTDVVSVKRDTASGDELQGLQPPTTNDMRQVWRGMALGFPCGASIAVPRIHYVFSLHGVLML